MIIQPLRQFTPGNDKTRSELWFQPKYTYRGLTDASIQYYLKDQKIPSRLNYDADDKLT